jgi:hypothetical protein
VCSRCAVISRHNWASPRFCSSMITSFHCILSPAVLPVRGANRSKSSTTGSRAHHEHAYPQFVLKNRGKCNEEKLSR